MRKLVGARIAAAVKAAKKALIALPIHVPRADSAEERRELAWDLETAEGKPGALPMSFPAGERVVLIAGEFRCVALADPGAVDTRGRHLFYQEEWAQRQGTTIVRRWAVAVDTTTGQHTMLRRYPFHEYGTTLQALYGELAEPGSARSGAFPSPDPGHALDDAVEARHGLDHAVGQLREIRRRGLEHNDAALGARFQLPVDDDLPAPARETLFAIRAKLAGFPAITGAESAVIAASAEAVGRSQTLEAAVAWAAGESKIGVEAIAAADREIALVRGLEKNAASLLTPRPSAATSQFPALVENSVVRLRRAEGPEPPNGMVRFRQEIWRPAPSGKRGREIERVVMLIDVDPNTGRQTPAARQVGYYPRERGDTVEDVYDQYAAQPIDADRPLQSAGFGLSVP